MNLCMKKIGMSQIKSVTVEPKNKADADKLRAGFESLAQDNPSVKFGFNKSTGKGTLNGVTEIQLEGLVDRLKKEFSVDVNTRTTVVGATFLWSTKLKVLGHKTLEKHGYQAMMLGAGEKKLSSWNKSQHYLFAEYEDKEAPETIYEYRTDNLLPVGTEIKPEEVFTLGSYVDVAGTTKGRGFSGVMKRHNFSGLPASHGVTKAHRKPGSTGHRTQPGRVFKGKKMPGHYGHERVTMQSLKVVLSESMELLGVVGSVIGVHGAVPGPNNGRCYLKHSVKKGGAV